MTENGISIQAAMSKWNLTQAQAEQLDKMDNDSDNGAKGNGKISGSIYDMAETYYETHKNENNNESARGELFNNLISWIKDTQSVLEQMKNGTLFSSDDETADDMNSESQ